MSEQQRVTGKMGLDGLESRLTCAYVCVCVWSCVHECEATVAASIIQANLISPQIPFRRFWLNDEWPPSCLLNNAAQWHHTACTWQIEHKVGVLKKTHAEGMHAPAGSCHLLLYSECRHRLTLQRGCSRQETLHAIPLITSPTTLHGGGSMGLRVWERTEDRYESQCAPGWREHWAWQHPWSTHHRHRQQWLCIGLPAAQ